MSEMNQENQQSIRVLYVDDEPALLEITTLYLQKMGYFTVNTAISADEALEKLKYETYDVIVSDYLMPEMDGIEFLKCVRDISVDIPFILFTGKGREEVVIQAINNGADSYLQKGGEPSAQFAELAHKIHQAFNRKQAEKALYESEKRLTDIINFLPDATFAIDEKGRVIAWNRAMEQITDIPAADMLGKNNYEYAIPFYGSRRPILIDLIFTSENEMARHYKNIIRQNDTLVAQTSMPRPRGNEMTVMSIASPLYNRKGDVIGAIESIRDITDLKRSEDELRSANNKLAEAAAELEIQYEELLQSEKRIRQSEVKFRSIVENSPIGMHFYEIQSDNTLVFVGANPGADKILGIDNKRFIGKSIEEAFPNLTGSEIPDRYRYVAINGGTWQNDQVLYEGEAIRGAYSVTAFQTLPGSMIAMFIDITQRKQEEDALREKQKKLKTALEGSNLGRWELDIKKRTLDIDKRWVTYLGYENEETRNDPDFWQNIIHSDDLEPVKKALLSYFEKEKSIFESDLRIRNNMGNWQWIQVRGKTVLSDFDGDPVKIAGTIQDITERRNTQNALEMANRKLNLLSDITRHDIMNQLTVLLGYLDIIKEKSSDTEILSYIEKEECAALTIKQQIEFTREYQNIGMKAPQWQNIATKFRDAAGHHYTKGIGIKVHMDLIEVCADPLLEKVFYNLIDNSLRYGGDTMKNIWISSRDDPEGLVISFEDDGIGIPDGEKRQIFSRGFGKTGGQGLFLVREILAITGITIEESGIPGKGARFEIFVPNGMFRENP